MFDYMKTRRVFILILSIWICLTMLLYLASVQKYRVETSYLRKVQKEKILQYTVNDTLTTQKTKSEKVRNLKEVENATAQNSRDDDNITLDDIFISVKTSGKYHSTRIELILKSWWNTASKQTFIFTDIDDVKLNNRTGGHLINTKCGNRHRRSDLTCKMGFEYDSYVQSNKKWWCHFDDDNYVNVKNLLKLLQKYDWKSDIYIGKLSTSNQMRVLYKGQTVFFWFGTGGAGICISKSLSEKMASWSRNGKLEATSNAIGVPDDCTIGFIINNRLGIELTTNSDFHSHLETLSQVSNQGLLTGITFSYLIADGSEYKAIRIREDSSTFSITKDPTRFLSLHCLLHPEVEWCPKSKKN